MSDTRLKITTTQPVTEKAAMYAAVHDGIPVVHKDGRRTECVTVSTGNAVKPSALPPGSGSGVAVHTFHQHFVGVYTCSPTMS